MLGGPYNAGIALRNIRCAADGEHSSDRGRRRAVWREPVVGTHVIFSSLAGLLFTPKLIGLMLLAIPLGIFFGCVPGLGGKLGIVLLIPFVYGMAPLPGAVFLLSMHSIVHTGGIVPSILFGVPTNGPEAPLLVDGYPMVRSGQAGRALGASLSAAGIGGMIGV